MHVGVLSMQRVINFGSFLQAYGLKQMLESCGYEVSFVDIRPGEYLDTAGPQPDGLLRKMRKHISRHPVQLARYNRYVAKRNQQFSDSWFSRIDIDKPVDESDCDAVVIGSDEVFNISPRASWGISYQLFGDVICDLVLSYAGSFANITYDDLCKLHIENKIAAAMGKLKSISVRDGASAETAKRVTGRDAVIHLDPVLVGDFRNVVPSSVPYDNYILVYSYDNRISNNGEIEAIRSFAKAHGKKLISFGFYQNWCDSNILVDPFTLLACFDHADYVITDTFHGSVLSIKRNRPFAAFVRKSNKNKLTDLMTSFDLSERIVRNPDDLPRILAHPILFDGINDALRCERERSKLYLTSNLA